MAKKQAAGLNLATVSAQIAKKGLGWEAGTTSLSDAHVSETQGFFGLAIEPERLAATAAKVRADEQFWGLMGVMAPPPMVDWRQKDGGDYVKPPRNQLNCQSCVAFAVVGAVEANARIAHRDPNYSIALSETDLFACGCGPCCGRGWFPEQALQRFKNVGVATAASVPYRPQDVFCNDNVGPRYRIADWKQLTTRQSIKQAIYEQGPCAYGMVVYDDFFRYYRSGVYRYSSGARLGNHAILIVGYDDSQNCWICRNSWGTEWGERGFFRIQYDDVSLFGENLAFPAFSIFITPVVAPPPTNTCEQYIPYLKSVISASWTNREMQAYLRFWVCRQAPAVAVNAVYDPTAKYVQSITQACPAYQKWFCDNLLSR